MYDVETHLRSVLAEVAAYHCESGRKGDIDLILQAVAVIMNYGPYGLAPERIVHIVLAVRHGRLSPNGAFLCLFRGDYSDRP